MKNKLFMIFLAVIMLFIFCTSITELAWTSKFYIPADSLPWAFEKAQWWEENRADMEASGLEASKPVIQTTPMNGINMHG